MKVYPSPTFCCRPLFPEEPGLRQDLRQTPRQELLHRDVVGGDEVGVALFLLDLPLGQVGIQHDLPRLPGGFLDCFQHSKPP